MTIYSCDWNEKTISEWENPSKCSVCLKSTYIVTGILFTTHVCALHFLWIFKLLVLYRVLFWLVRCRRRSAMSLPPYLLGPNPWATMMAQQQLAAAQQAALQAHAAAAAAAPPVPPAQPPKPHHIPEEKIKEKGRSLCNLRLLLLRFCPYTYYAPTKCASQIYIER